MKKLIYYILPILSVMFVPTSCMDKHDAPVINDNDGSGIITSSTIKELKDKYKSVISSDGYQLIEEDALIRGVVVGNDESGNIYKQLFVQDETGGICISIDGNNMNTNFHVGQELAIDCKGLYIGGYGGMAQIGAVYTDSSGKQKIGRMSPFVWDAHHTKIGSATPEKIPAPVVITSANQFKEEYIGKLVSLENVHFDMPGIYTFANYLASEAGTESKTMYFDRMRGYEKGARRVITSRNLERKQLLFAGEISDEDYEMFELSATKVKENKSGKTLVFDSQSVLFGENDYQ